ncbi:MAG: HAD family hydrolase [Deltaproteobacteria bacterium]|nr:HAD family hydrolase [Deltaproteobacteria bacterium]
MATLVAAGGSHPDEASRAAAVEALWRAQPARNLWRDVPNEARALLDDLGRAGVRMVITSNSEGRVAALLEEVGIAHHFVAILDSGVLGFGKPDRRIFARAAEALGAPLDAIMHIGDSEAADVLGARAAGAFTVRFDGFVPGADARPTMADVRVSSFTALRETLSVALDLDLSARS